MSLVVWDCPLGDSLEQKPGPLSTNHWSFRDIVTEMVHRFGTLRSTDSSIVNVVIQTAYQTRTRMSTKISAAGDELSPF